MKHFSTALLGSLTVTLLAAAPQPGEAGTVFQRATTLGSLFTNNFAPVSDQVDFAARVGDGANYATGLRRRCIGAAESLNGPIIPAEIATGQGATCEYRNYFVFDLRDQEPVDLDPELSNARLTLPTAFASVDTTYELRFVASGDASDLAAFTGLSEGFAVDSGGADDESPFNPLIDNNKTAFDAIGDGPVIGTLENPGDPFEDICLDGNGDLLYPSCEFFPPMRLVDIAFNSTGVAALEQAFGSYLVLGGTIADTDSGQLFGFGTTNDFVQLSGNDPNFFQPSQDFLFGDNFLTLSYKVPAPGAGWLLAFGAAGLLLLGRVAPHHVSPRTDAV